jgi:hypothetical protein
VEGGLIPSLHNTVCQEQQDLFIEISSLKCILQLNGYPQGFIDAVINSSNSECYASLSGARGSVVVKATNRKVAGSIPEEVNF